MIRVVRSSYIELKDTEFDENWLLETIHDSSRAQLLYATQFYGEIKLDKLIVKNHVGMNNFQVTDISALGASLATASDIMAPLSSMYSLIKWQSSDYVKFYPNFVTSGTTFDKVYYQQNNYNLADRMFWPALTSSVSGATSFFIADSFTFKDVTFNDIQCYGCQNSPFYISTRLATFDTVTMTNINDKAYSQAGCYYGCKQVNPFF